MFDCSVFPLESECESFAEARFLEEARRFEFRPDLVMEAQVELETRFAVFRPDFRIGRTLIEVDGKRFHAGVRDDYRDAVLLWTGLADDIIRLRAKDILYHGDDVFFCLSRMHREWFTPHGVLKIRAGTSTTALRASKGCRRRMPPPITYRNRSGIDIDWKRRDGRTRDKWRIVKRLGYGPHLAVADRRNLDW